MNSGSRENRAPLWSRWDDDVPCVARVCVPWRCKGLAEEEQARRGDARRVAVGLGWGAL